MKKASNIHNYHHQEKIQIFNAKCSHSFGAPLAKALLTSDHHLDYAEQTEHPSPIACTLLRSFHEDTDQEHQMLITVAFVPKCKTNGNEFEHLESLSQQGKEWYI
jgi:hypothetical protein